MSTQSKHKDRLKLFMLVFGVCGLLLLLATFATVNENGSISVDSDASQLTGPVCDNADHIVLGDCYPPPEPKKLLVLTNTDSAYFNHASIPAGVKMLKEMEAKGHFEAEYSNDPAIFLEDNIDRFGSVVLLNLNGNAFPTVQMKEAFKTFVRDGDNSVVAVHNTVGAQRNTGNPNKCLAECSWPWFHIMLGDTNLASHPASQTGTVETVNTTHQATQNLPARWDLVNEEWYDLTKQPSNVTPLLNVDNDSYTGSVTPEPHVISWLHDFEGAKVWVTTLGHDSANYNNLNFRRHILNGIQWSLE